MKRTKKNEIMRGATQIEKRQSLEEPRNHLETTVPLARIPGIVESSSKVRAVMNVETQLQRKKRKQATRLRMSYEIVEDMN